MLSNVVVFRLLTEECIPPGEVVPSYLNWAVPAATCRAPKQAAPELPCSCSTGRGAC